MLLRRRKLEGGVSGPGSNVVMVIKVDTYFARHQVEMEMNGEGKFLWFTSLNARGIKVRGVGGT